MKLAVDNVFFASIFSLQGKLVITAWLLLFRLTLTILSPVTFKKLVNLIYEA